MKCLLISLFLFIGTLSSFAQLPGSIDPSFGRNGIVQVNIASSVDIPYTLLRQSDAKVLCISNRLVGQGESMTAVHRFNSDGSLDTAYGHHGVAGEYLRGSDYQGTAAALQADGMLLICGSHGDAANAYSQGFLIQRFTTSGALDAGFGVGGRISHIFDSNGNEQALNVIVQADGKILLIGFTAKSDTTTQMGIMRLLANGQLDASFGTEGKRTISLSASSDDKAYRAQLLAGGKILIVGVSTDATVEKAVVAVLNANGSFDSAFGTDGIVSVALGMSGLSIRSLDITSGGQLILSGNVLQGTMHQGVVARLLSNGTLDASFGTLGFALTKSASNPAGISSTLVQADGKILCIGSVPGSSSDDLDVIVSRFTANGLPDASFGTSGVSLHLLSAQLDAGRALCLQADGKILTANNKNTTGMTYMRLLENGMSDNTFGSGTSGAIDLAVGKAIDQPNSSILLADGSMVIGGTTNTFTGADYALTKFLANGSLDMSFGEQGKTTLNFNGANDLVFGVHAQSDGKIVLVGEEVIGDETSGSSIFKASLARFTADGKLDNSFAGGGKMIFEFGNGDDGFWGSTLQADDKILCAGYTLSGDHYDALLMRFMKNGEADTTFGEKGIVRVHSDTADYDMSQVLQLKNGTIICTGTYNGAALMYAFEANGAPLTTFGEQGMLSMSYRSVGGITKLDDGGFVAIGFSLKGDNDWGSALLRFRSDLSRDMNFGSSGSSVIDMDQSEVISKVAVQSDGKFVCTGYRGIIANNSVVEYDILLARLNADGSRDASFGTDGIVISRPGDIQDGRDIHFSPDGKILLTASLSNQGEADFGIVRYFSGLSTGVLDFSSTHSELICTNPLQAQNTLEFELSTQEAIEISLIDLSGTTTILQPSTVLSAGKHSIAFSANTLSHGTYVVRVSNGQSAVDVKLVK